MGIDRAKLRWNGWGWAASKDDIAERAEVWTWLAAALGMPALLATPGRPLEELKLPDSKLSLQDRVELSGMVGADQVRDTVGERAFHALGRSYHDLLRLRAGDMSSAPDAVVYPRSTEEVLAVIAYASRKRIAVVPYGGGTGVVGGVRGDRGPFATVIALDVSEMDRVIDINPTSCTATVEAGIYGPALEKALQAKGFTLGHTPQSFEFSTLGGWIAHRGAGQGANRYGRADDWLVSAKLATPRGLLSNGDFPATSAGPRLTDLIAGSEGAFGVITEAVLRIRPLPEVCEFRGYLFRDFQSGAAAIRAAMQDGCGCAMLRLSDADETQFQRAYTKLAKIPGAMRRAINRYLKLRGFAENSCLLIAGYEGDKQTTALTRRRFGDIAGRFGAVAMGRGAGDDWRRSRFQAPYLRDPMLDRGVGIDMIETAASWSKLDAVYAATRAALENALLGAMPREDARAIVMCHISHAYADGASLCFTIIFPRRLDGDIEQWKKIKAAATETILANGGTLSHHHGVGADHLPWMVREKGALGMDVLRAMKQVLDPEGILNPGKLVP
jgi:alkyldihydroxyacetonephosphate synthase